MEKILHKAAFDFFRFIFKGECLSALVFFDENISPYIKDEIYERALESWFFTLNKAFHMLDQKSKKLISFAIDDNDIFACLSTEKDYWKSLN